MGITENISRNFIYLMANFFVVSFLSFIFWTFIGSKNLPPQDYGKATTLLQIFMLLLSISNLGIYTASCKKIPELISKNQENKIPTLLRFSFKVSFIATTISSIILFFIFKLNLLEKISLAHIDLILIISLIFLSQVSSVNASYWYGYQNMRKLFFANLFSFLGKVGIAAILIYIGFGYLALLIGFLTQTILQLLITFTKKLFEIGSKFNTKKFFIEASIPAFISAIFQLILTQTPFIFLSFIRSTEETGYFSLAFMITSVAFSLPTVLASSIFPVISGLQEIDKQEKIINFSLRYSILFSSLALILLMLFSESFILIVASEKYITSAKIFNILVISLSIGGILNILLSNIYAAGFYKIFRNINIIEVITYIPSIILLTYFSGFYGTALSFLLTSIVGLIGFLLFSRNVIKISFDLKDLIKISFACFIIYIVWVGIKILELNFLIKVFLIAITLPIYILVLKLTKFFTETDKAVISILLSKLKLKFLINFF
ncbi:MAG: oligosaccharide flippase family protein [Candidatus Aenigmatarchaeota archaeon]